MYALPRNKGSGVFPCRPSILGGMVHKMRENSGRTNTKDGELMMKNANTPAAPTAAKISDTGDAWAYQIGGDATFQFPGLTKREIFAMTAMQAQVSALNNEYAIELFTDAMEERCIPLEYPERLIAINAINYADALLAELEK